jgi:hypothetical protein
VHPKRGRKNRQFKLTEINDYGTTSVAVVCRDLVDFQDWKKENFITIKDIDIRRFESGDKIYYAVCGVDGLISKQFDEMMITYFAPTSENYNEIIATIKQCIKIKKSKAFLRLLRSPNQNWSEALKQKLVMP